MGRLHSKSPIKFSPMTTAIHPTIKYHARLITPKSPPTREAIAPKIVKVIERPRMKVNEYRKAFRRSPSEYPPTYPITRGMVARTQGLEEERMPPRKTPK